MTFKYKNKTLQISRYPGSSNRSLRPWSAADELMLSHIEESEIQPKAPIIYHDRFGFLTCALQTYSPISVVNYMSQEKAIRMNLEASSLPIDPDLWVDPLSEISASVDLGLVKIPKSMDLFRLYLNQISKVLVEEGVVICSFMTRHFTKQMLEVAGEFFEEIEQSKAVKKARLLILKGKKKITEVDLLNTLDWEGNTFKQYGGVFSAQHIDYATQFLIENLEVNKTDTHILDLACGNGIIAAEVRKQHKDAEIHLVDDSFLAVESARLNITSGNAIFHHADSLERFQNKFFDRVISNPPFHFEYETNIDVPLELFKQVRKILKPGGVFQLVSSKHLNFKTHLVKHFPEVKVFAENDKFEVYRCVK